MKLVIKILNIIGLFVIKTGMFLTLLFIILAICNFLLKVEIIHFKYKWMEALYFLFVGCWVGFLWKLTNNNLFENETK